MEIDERFLNSVWLEKNFPHTFQLINSNFDDELSWKEKLFLYKNNLSDKPKCKNCNNYVLFLNFKRGYRDYCSRKCTANATKYKKIQTNLNKYGVENPMQCNSIKEKLKDSMIEKYGIDNISKLDSIKQLKKDINLKKFGVEYNSQREEVKQKLSSLMLEKSKKMNDDKTKNLYHYIENKISEYKELTLIDINSSNYKLSCFKCNSIFNINKNTLNDRIKNKNTICTICNPINNSSDTQNQIFDFIKDLSKEKIESNCRKLGFELDIFLPERNLAFEYNGIYWHSSEYKDRLYHFNKTKICNQNGIRLIHIWEDTWQNKKDIVVSRIKNLLGFSKKIFARKCRVDVIDSTKYRQFVEENHIQGYAAAKIKLGLFYQDELVSIMSFNGLRISLGSKPTQNSYEMIRFCNKLDLTVVGGASKLFKYFQKNYIFEKIISYADKSWSNGDLYHKLGFSLVKETQPNYYYTKNGIRYNRFSYRKQILIRKGFDNNLSESEIMKQNNYYKIFDSGNYKFEFYR